MQELDHVAGLQYQRPNQHSRHSRPHPHAAILENSLPKTGQRSWEQDEQLQPKTSALGSGDDRLEQSARMSRFTIFQKPNSHFGVLHNGHGKAPSRSRAIPQPRH